MVVQTKEQIFLLLHQSQEKLKKFGVKRCGLFGSFLHERQNLQTDLPRDIYCLSLLVKTMDFSPKLLVYGLP